MILVLELIHKLFLSKLREEGTDITVNAEHSSKAELPIDSTDEGNEISVNDEHL